MRVGPIPNARLRWDRVQDEFIAKSIYAQNNLEMAIYNMRCPRGGDVCTFLTSLRYKCEELVVAGVCISNKDYQCMVLRGIPEEPVCFASSILSSARLIHRVSTIEMETLINHICKEDDQLKNHCARLQPNQSQSGAKSQATGDKALAATGSKGKRRCKGKCHNCGKQGHWACKCQSPKKEMKLGDKAPKAERGHKPETKPIGSVNAVATRQWHG